MGPILASLLKLQSIEHDLAHVRRRLRSKENAVKIVQKKIDELQSRREALHEQARSQQMQVDQAELERTSRENSIANLRVALNKAKTNKEYAALLTQINTIKADNSKLEEQTLKSMESVDAVKAEMAKVDEEIAAEQAMLDKVTATNAEEIGKLNGILADLEAKRSQAAAAVDSDSLRAFERIAAAKDGEAMAPIEVSDDRQQEFTCGGCYMSLSAENYNALLSRDEIRHCDSCGRILYIEEKS